LEQANESHRADHVRIHIDREPYESPSPTSGAALYALGQVIEHHDLFREIGGDREDELVERHAHDVKLKADEHFYSQKVFTIIVDTEPKEVTKNRLSFDDVVKLAFETVPTGPNILITVDYGMGPPENPKGSLKKGQSVRIKNHMIFDVSATDRS
jgi:hypothetical protein